MQNKIHRGKKFNINNNNKYEKGSIFLFCALSFSVCVCANAQNGNKNGKYGKNKFFCLNGKNAIVRFNIYKYTKSILFGCARERERVSEGKMPKMNITSYNIASVNVWCCACGFCFFFPILLFSLGNQIWCGEKVSLLPASDVVNCVSCRKHPNHFFYSLLFLMVFSHVKRSVRFTQHSSRPLCTLWQLLMY